MGSNIWLKNQCGVTVFSFRGAPVIYVDKLYFFNRIIQIKGPCVPIVNQNSIHKIYFIYYMTLCDKNLLYATR